MHISVMTTFLISMENYKFGINDFQNFKPKTPTAESNETPEENCTTLPAFILLVCTIHLEVEIPLLGLFLLIYTTALVGNAGVIVLIQLNTCLHTPMCYFLSNLSFLDLICSSAIAPKMLVNLLAQQKTISLTGCATQMLLFAAFADAECLILAAMAYDCYVAICHPLLVAMSCMDCTSMVAGAYLSGGLTSLVHKSFMFTLSFSGSKTINDFLCDTPSLLELCCSNAHLFRQLRKASCGKSCEMVCKKVEYN
ncbi:LOW QUALITY PROTEIN: olfactory receptor 5AS1-like [Cariama cristata]